MKISNFKNLNEISYFQFQKFNKEEHLYFNNPNLKKLEIYTWSETRSYSLKLAKYLNEKNVNKGDRVLIVSSFLYCKRLTTFLEKTHCKFL